MTAIPKLSVAITGDSTDFIKELNKSKSSADNWGSKVRTAVSAGGTAIVASAAMAAAGLAAIYKAQSESIDQTAKFADRIGMTTESLSQLQYASELTGVGSDTLNMAMQRMTRRVEEAAAGSGEAVDALDALGVSAQTLADLTPDQQLAVLADAFQDVESQSERVRIAFKLFDSEGVSMVNMLANGSDGLRDMASEADILGVTLSRIDAAKVEMANDAMYKVNQVSDALFKSITINLAPIVAQLADDFTNAAKEAGGFNLVVADTVGVFVKGFGWIATSFRGWEIIIATLKFRVAELAYDIMNSFQMVSDFTHEAGKAIFNPILEGAWSALNALGQWSDSAKEAAESMREAMDAPAPIVFDDFPNIMLEYGQAQHDLQMLLAQPLPVDSAEAWLDAVREKAEQAAAAISSSINRNSGGDGFGGRNSEVDSSAVSSFQAATESIKEGWSRRLAIEAAGQQSAFAQESFSYKDRTAALAQQFTKAYDAAKGNLGLQDELESSYFASRETLWKEHQANLSKIERDEAENRQLYQQRVAADLLTFTQQQMSITLGAMQDMGEESSNFYKVLFAAQKAAAIPSMVIATEEAATKALTLGPIAGPIASGAVKALGYTSIGIVAGQALAGMAHSGMDYIPSEGTWLLDRGERVLTNNSAQKMDQMHDAVVAGGQSNQPQINIYQTIQANGDKTLLTMISQASNQAIEAAYNRVDRDFATKRGIAARI